MSADSMALVIAGSGGAGVMTAGALLLEAACRAGYYGLFSRLSGPQIRGGEAAALLRFAPHPIEGPPDCYDALFALDWRNVDRFAAEIPLDAESLIISEYEAGEPPPAILAAGSRWIAVPVESLAKEIYGGRPNMAAVGMLSAMLGLDEEAVMGVLPSLLAEKGPGALEAGRRAVAVGRAAAEGLGDAVRLPPPQRNPERWLISGNQALALGALRGGVRFVAGYPITPATEVLEWIGPAVRRLGGAMVQAEDELASIGMCIGASYAGAPSLTATSGPGLSLMVESLGLAIASEIPLVIIDVMRGGPSTGIPTKSEQSDLNLALYGVHGDAPHLVLAPLSLADCLFTSAWAAELAEALQVPAIVLADQSQGQARAIVDPPGPAKPMATRKLPDPSAIDDYRRYALDDSGISPMSIPGLAGCQYIADGLTHNESGTPSSAARDHLAQLDKRARKLAEWPFGPAWAEIEGEGEVALITWGSLTGPAREACRRARARGLEVKLIALRLLAPLQTEALLGALKGVRRVVVLEQNHSGQLLGYLRSKVDLPGRIEGVFRPGPLPLRPAEMLAALLSESRP